MTDYKKYINALRKCAKEHENDRTSTGHIIVSDLCRDTANLLESLEQEPCEDCISREFMYKLGAKCIAVRNENDVLVAIASIESLPPATPKQKTGHWYRKYEYGNLYCSECNHEYLGLNLKPKFCEECGAEMSEIPTDSEKE